MTNPNQIRRDFKRNGEKLPKITLKSFSGEPFDWKSFKETLEAAVHDNESITSTEKFTYLNPIKFRAPLIFKVNQFR